MIEFLDSIDKQWLLAINNDYSDFWDGVMYTYSGKLPWIPFYLSIIIAVVLKWKKQSWIMILAMVLAVVLADQIASGVIKNLVCRLRPSHDSSLVNDIVLVRGYKSGLYGFVSSHAANSFAIALFASLLLRNRLFAFTVFGWAAINSYSRMYLGVHYPGDILGGTFVGLLVAYCLYLLIKRIKPELMRVQAVGNIEVWIPVSVFLITCVVIVGYSFWYF